MSTTIDAQNALQIRQPIEIYAGINARQTGVTISNMTASGTAVQDTAIITPLTTPEWDMRKLTDFQGEGFILDGSCELYDSTLAASLDDGKVGLRSDIGNDMTVTVSSSQQMTAVTIAVTSGSGTITKGADTYDIRRIVVVPVNSTSVTFTVNNSNPNERVEIASITPGIVLEFDNTNIVSCSLDLRSDLSIIGPSWQISSIEIQAYWDDDISEAVSNIGDDVPIWYYAGYDGDYSTVRNFYLSEAVTMTNNLLTIHGEDMSAKLEKADSVKIRRLDSVYNSGWKTLYNYFVSLIKGAGIKADTQSAPNTSGANTTGVSMVLQEASPRDYVADIMNHAHVGTFYPTFVDAGIPKITWTKPTAKWDIYEADCGDVTDIIDRNVAKIKTPTDSAYGVVNTCTRSSKWTVIQKDIKIKSGVPITKNFSDVWYWTYRVAYAKNRKFDWLLLNSVKWTPAKTTTKKKITKKVNGKKKTVTTWLYRPTLYGKKLTTTVNKRSITESQNRAGYTAEVNPLAIGVIRQNNVYLYPFYERLFDRDNKGGSFKWKGDPRMQPRDVVNFHRLDGTVETITIETISTTHSGGGMVSDITYKKGII